MKLTKIGLAAATTVAAGLLVFGGSTLASAATPAPAPSASSGTTPSDTTPGHGGHGPRGTEVTGDEATKVGAAVTAKDSTVTVEHVLKAEDGTYRVLGTKDGTRVMFQVSADLATVTQQAARSGGDKGGRGHGGGERPDAAPSASPGTSAN